jgi:hypothetical protein
MGLPTSPRSVYALILAPIPSKRGVKWKFVVAQLQPLLASAPFQQWRGQSVHDGSLSDPTFLAEAS